MELGDPERALGYFKRAFDINPNLPGSAATIEQLERQLRNKRKTMI
jgi:tetratricopeptide (TPR) repeat protein